jgi:hypothetical protein
MPKGTHSSVRVALAVPPKLHEQLEAWAAWEGRPLASLCLYLVEQSLRQAQRDGIAPSFANEGEGDGIDKWDDNREFNGWRHEKVTNQRTAGGPSRSEILSKKEEQSNEDAKMAKIKALMELLG